MLVVTGPTGNVGADVARLLVESDQGITYRLAAHDPARIAAEYGPEVPCARLEYRDRSTWPPVLDGIETLFLLYPLPQPWTVRSRMVPFIDAAVAAGCRHIIYVATPGSDTIKANPHYQVERHIESTGVSWTFLHASFFMQNLVRRVSTHGWEIALRDEIVIPAGRGRTTFIDARDVATVVLKIVHDPAPYKNTTLNLTGPERLDYHQVADTLSEVLGRRIRYTEPSFPRFWARALRRGVRLDVLAFMTLVYTLTRRGKNEPVTGDLAAELGHPGTSLRQFAEDYRWRWDTLTWT